MLLKRSSDGIIELLKKRLANNNSADLGKETVLILPFIILMDKQVRKSPLLCHHERRFNGNRHIDSQF